jgi:hypothetical protein
MGKIIVAASIVVAALIGGSVAYASIPDSSGVIHGCYNNYTGALRIIDSGASSCYADETGLNWNQSVPSIYTETSLINAASGPSHATVSCATGDTALSGGVEPYGSNPVALQASYQASSGSWYVSIDTDVSDYGTAQVVCLTQ